MSASLPWLEEMHPAQRSFHRDPAKRKAALCGGRAGKTNGDARELIDAAMTRPSGIAAYITLTRPEAKRNVWGPLCELVRRYGLLQGQPNESELNLTLISGGRIWCAGCDDESQMESFRGPKYSRVIVDEAASFRRYLEPLVNRVIAPRCLDLGAEILLTGTPGAACVGFFHDATTGGSDNVAAWPTHHWTALDNPHLPNAKEYFAQVLRDNKWTVDNPTFRREYLGEWIRDDDALVYPYDDKLNGVDDLPAGHVWRYVLSIDIGFVDATAWALAAYSSTIRRAFVVRSWKQTGMTPSDVADMARRVQSEQQCERIVVDTSGIGKAYAEQMTQRYRLPVQAAQKSGGTSEDMQKPAFVRHLAGDIRAGRIAFVRATNRQMIEEMALLQWNEHRTRIDERYEDHLCDALLYAWRECRQYLSVDVGPAPAMTEQQRLTAERVRQVVDYQRTRHARWYDSRTRRTPNGI